MSSLTNFSVNQERRAVMLLRLPLLQVNWNTETKKDVNDTLLSGVPPCCEPTTK